MQVENKKCAAIVLEGLGAGIVANSVLHLGVQLGALAREIAGAPVDDASGITHSGLPICPNVVLAADGAVLRACLAAARAQSGGNDLVVLDYPEQGNSTRTDAEYRDAIQAAHEAEIVYYAALLFGDRRIINKLTRGLQLWGTATT